VKQVGISIEDLLRDLRGQGLNVGAIAQRIDVPYATARRWLARYGLDDASLIRRALEVAYRLT
jgi:transposase